MFGPLKRLRAVLFGEATAKTSDPDDLFDISTGYVTLGAEGYEGVDRAGLCFSRVDSVDFERAVQDAEDILAETAREQDGDYRIEEDDHGYLWALLSDPDFEDLVTGVHVAADTLIEAGYTRYLLFAVFAFERNGREVYWVYNFKRGAWYPFVPKSGGGRNERVEGQLIDLVGTELDVEEAEDRRYPLWGVPF